MTMPASDEPTRAPKKRSRTGCLACLHSKVKCDETSPVCKRCTRTKKHCTWPEPRPALRDRRRGHGPYKDRTVKLLQPLVPASQPQSPEEATTTTTIEDTANTFIVPRRKSRNVGKITTTAPAEPSEIANFIDASADPRLESCDNNYTNWDDLQSGALVFSEEGASTSNPFLDDWIQQQSSQAVAVSIPYALQTSHIPSSSSVTIGPPEWEALQFFERIFATVYSPKTFSWSFLAIMAEFGKEHAAIQHLIVAVCLGQLDQTSANDSFLRLGKSHYQQGAQLVMQDMNHAQHDHCKIFTTFWLIQAVYNTYWSDRAATSLDKLSQTMAQYVRNHRLLELFSKKGGAFSKSPETAFMPRKNRGLLARLIVICLYEDIDADFCHAGGAFAAEVCSDDAAIRGVYFAGRNCMAQYFESIYPQHELLDDIQRSNLLDLHFEANLALHRINQASQRTSSLERFEKIARELDDLRMQYDAVFELTQIKNHENRKVGSSANNVVAHFLAVETYNLQCLQLHAKDLSYTVELDSTIQSLLRAIGYLCTEWPSNMPYRNQWLFFIAGVGTSDPIHVAWIIDKLKQGRYFQTLRRIVEIQRSSEVQMSIDDVRSLFWGLGNDLLSAERETTLVLLNRQKALQDREPQSCF